MTYPSDLTDAQWTVIETLLPADKARGRQRKYSRRELLNAIFYVNKTGCQWRCLPSYFPLWNSVYGYFRKLSNNKIFEIINNILVSLERKRQGRFTNPSLICIDSQSVKGDVNLKEKGLDGNKKVNGRKRHIAVDVLGLLISCYTTAANVADVVIGRKMLGEFSDKKKFPRLKKILVDRVYQGMEDPDGIKVEMPPSNNPKKKGFIPEWKRWVVERTFAWFYRQRRICREYEIETKYQNSMVLIASIRLLLNRFVTN